MYYSKPDADAFAHLVLAPVTLDLCQQFVEEYAHADALRDHGIKPRSRMLLTGPSGCGKTALALALAAALGRRPLLCRDLLPVPSMHADMQEQASDRNLLVVDSFNPPAAAGIGRAALWTRVEPLLFAIDDGSLPGPSILVVTTNHPLFFDPRVQSRFDLVLDLPRPDQHLLEVWFQRLGERLATPLGYAPAALAQTFAGASFADLEALAMHLRRQEVIRPAPTLAEAITGWLDPLHVLGRRAAGLPW